MRKLLVSGDIQRPQYSEETYHIRKHGTVKDFQEARRVEASCTRKERVQGLTLQPGENPPALQRRVEEAKRRNQ